MSRSGWHGTAFALLGAALIALYAPTFAWLWSRWTTSVWQDAHGLFVPPLVLWMAWVTLRRLPVPRPESSPWGYVFVVPALLLHVADTAMHTQLLSAVSFVLLLPGLSLLLLGTRRTRAIAFPLAFAAFALPIPLSLTEPVHLALRHVATQATSALVPFLGIPVFAEETTLHLANATLIVGDACSGFSTLYAALAVACLTAYQAVGWPRQVLVLASAAPLAIVANILRIVLLVAVVHATGVDVLQTWVHPASGLMTFALSLPVILWLGGPAPDAAPVAAQVPVAAGVVQGTVGE